MNPFSLLVSEIIKSGNGTIGLEEAVQMANQQLGTSYSTLDLVNMPDVQGSDMLSTLGLGNNAASFSNISEAAPVENTYTTNGSLAYSGTPAAAAGAAGAKGLFAKARGMFGKDKTLLKGSVPSLKGLAGDIRSTKLIEGLPSLGNIANIGMGIYQGGKAAKGIIDNANTDTDLSSLKNDIAVQIASNPMHDMYLDAEDEKTLRQLKNGTLDNNWGDSVSGMIQGLPQTAITSIIGGLAGGPLGAVLGGAGSLGNSAISGYGKGNEKTMAKLQGLYSRLKQANDEYRSMRRPAGLHRAGLQTKYFNQLY